MAKKKTVAKPAAKENEFSFTMADSDVSVDVKLGRFKFSASKIIHHATLFGAVAAALVAGHSRSSKAELAPPTPETAIIAAVPFCQTTPAALAAALTDNRNKLVAVVLPAAEGAEPAIQLRLEGKDITVTTAIADNIAASAKAEATRAKTPQACAVQTVTYDAAMQGAIRSRMKRSLVPGSLSPR